MKNEDYGASLKGSGVEGADVVATGASRKAYLKGQYDAYSLLLTSPRMNAPQREVITNIALGVKDELEALGVAFAERA